MTSEHPTGKLKIPTENTRTKILKHLLGKDLSAIDLSEKLEINESAVRRHLSILEEKDLVRHYFRKMGRGRPKKLFSLTSSGRELFPKKTGLFLQILIQKVREKFGKEAIETLLTEMAEELKEYFLSKEGGNLREQLEELLKALDDFGFFPSLHEEENSFIIEYRNCVFDKAAQELGQLLCKLHTELLRSSLDKFDIKKETSLLDEGTVCRHRIRK